MHLEERRVTISILEYNFNLVIMSLFYSLLQNNEDSGKAKNDDMAKFKLIHATIM